MARAITGAAILFTAQTGPAEEGFKRVRGKAQGFGSDLDNTRQQTTTFSANIATMTKKLAGAAAAFLSVGAAIRSFTGSMRSAAETAATADRLGIDVEDLQRLRFAAEELDVATSSVESALARMNRRLGRAALEGGPATEAMERLGISAERLTRLPAAERFIAVAQALRGVANESERAGIAQGIFGTQVDDIIPLLRLSRSELQALFEQAEESGRVLREDTIQSLADSAKELERFMAEARAGAARMASEVTPAIGPVLKGLRDTLAVAQAIGERLEAWRRPMQWAIDGARLLAQDLGLVESAQVVQVDLAQQMRDLEQQRHAERMDALRTEVSAMMEGEREAIEAGRRARDEADQERLDRIEEIRKKQQEHFDDMKSSAEALERSLRTPFERAVDDVIELREMMRTLGPAFLSPEVVGRRMAQIRRQIREMVEGETPGVAQERGVGGVRLGEAAGFSALQEARRNERTASQERQRQTAVLGRVEELMSRLVDAVEQGEEVSIDMVDLAR